MTILQLSDLVYTIDLDNIVECCQIVVQHDRMEMEQKVKDVLLLASVLLEKAQML